MKNITIYASERQDGLADKIRQSNILAYESLISCDENFDVSNFKNVVRTIAKRNDDPILFYLQSILATCGTNKNDDTFLAEELWNAKHTPVDKPLNIGHEESRIIGHIVDTHVIDKSNNILDINTAVDELPSIFHIVTGSVIYTYYENDTKREEIQKLVSEILNGEWRVSMEAVFPNFDYGVVEPDGTQKIVARSKATAYLTKYLRIYGGPGVYKDKKITRIPRGLIFSGKGLVKNPANPDSIIFNSVSEFRGISIQSGELDKIIVINTKNSELKMPDVNTELESKLAKLQADNEALVKQIKEIDTQKLESEIKSYKDTIVIKDEELVKVNAKAADLEKSVENLSTSLKEATDKINTLTAEINDAKVKQLKAARASLLVSAGKTDEEALSLVEKFSGVNDEVFQTIVDLAKASKPVAQTPEKTVASVLDGAKPEGEVNLVTPSDDDASKFQKAVAGIQNVLKPRLKSLKNS